MKAKGSFIQEGKIPQVKKSIKITALNRKFSLKINPRLAMKYRLNEFTPKNLWESEFPLEKVSIYGNIPHVLMLLKKRISPSRGSFHIGNKKFHLALDALKKGKRSLAGKRLHAYTDIQGQKMKLFFLNKNLKELKKPFFLISSPQFDNMKQVLNFLYQGRVEDIQNPKALLSYFSFKKAN